MSKERHRNPLFGRRIALGVTGSIAAYKAAGIASQLTQAGAVVDVLMTPEATRLVQPLTFQALTHRPTLVDMFHLLAETEIGHVTMAREADLVIIAPATAHSIAKFALGLADDMVATTVLATTAPIIVAPAMESHMWRHPATQGHVETLVGWGWVLVEPERGHLASGAQGEGRLADPERIVDVARATLGRHGDLAGLHVAVTAGGTREPLDPVRFLSNRSSGKMGYALAGAARDRGARVTLISTVGLPVPSGVELVAVERAEEMRNAVLGCLPDLQALVMAAAVADYRPAAEADQKIKKQGAELTLSLALTPDILEAVAATRGERADLVVVGFAAETEQLLDNARSKLGRKQLDLIVANDVTLEDSGFGSDLNKVTILGASGFQRDLPLQPKLEVAHHIWDEVLALRGQPQK